MKVANTSESECIASETMAPELPAIPAASLTAVRSILPNTPTAATRFIILLLSVVLYSVNLSDCIFLLILVEEVSEHFILSELRHAVEFMLPLASGYRLKNVHS